MILESGEPGPEKAKKSRYNPKLREDSDLVQEEGGSPRAPPPQAEPPPRDDEVLWRGLRGPRDQGLALLLSGLLLGLHPDLPPLVDFPGSTKLSVETGFAWWF